MNPPPRRGMAGAALLAAVIATGLAGSAEARPERLVFVGSDALAPYQYLDEAGEPRGFNIELMRALARETGIDIEIRLLDAPTVLPIVERGEADLVCLTQNGPRSPRFTWLLPLWHVRQVAVSTRPLPRAPRSVGDLQGETVVVARGSVLWEELQAIPAPERPALLPITERDFAEGASHLIAGNATVMIGNALRLTQLGIFREFPGLRETTIRSIPYYLASGPGREELQPIFSEAFTRLQESGEFNAIVERTLLDPPEEDWAASRWGQYLLGALAVAGLALVGVVTWNRTLQTQVESRTSEMRAVAERLEVHGLVQAQVSDAIIVLNPEKRITIWNAGAEALFGIPASQALGGSVDILRALTIDVDTAGVRAEVERRGIWRGETKIRRQDGGEVYVEATVQVLRDADGGADGRLIVVHDVDARRRAEDELRGALAMQRATLDSAAEAILSVDVDGRITSYNRRYLDIWGLPPDEVEGASFEELVERRKDLLVEPDSGITALRRAMASEGVDIATFTLKDGRVIERYCVPQRLDGEVIGRLWSYRDVTERSRAEQERRRLEGQLQQVQRLESLGVLAGGIAHDFNNLLVGMLGHADLALMDLPPDSPVRDRIQQIETCAKRAAELTNQMLAYSGKGHFVIQPVDLGSVVREMTNLLQTAISKNATLDLRLAEDLPAVAADGAQLRQVVMNLITNASDALGDRPGTIAVTTGVMFASRGYLEGACAASAAEPGDYVYLEVRDDGCGMDAETRERIFEPFFTTKFTGRGLGLAAVLGIVRGHRGAVRLQTEVGRGTSFRVLFPASPSEAVVDAPPVRRARAQRQARVLVVDDEPAVRTIAREALTRAGFTVVLAAGGEEAVERFRAEGPAIDAVLLDMTMPGMNGVDTLRAIHNLVREVPVVLTSGYSEQEAADRCGGEKLAGFIQKPFAPSALVAKINEAIVLPSASV